MNSTSSKVIVAIIVIALFAGGVLYFRRNQSETVAETPNNTNSSQQVQGKIYRNGTYQVVGNYISPGGPESIGVTLVLEGDKVADATVVSNATLPASKMMQEDFIANFKAQVIGMDLSTLNLTKVSGSSLTPKGFNDAVAEIKTQAQI